MKKLLILSGKGGTGKTTTAAAFIAFSKARAFADCDVDAPNLHLVSQAMGEAEHSDFMGSDNAFIDREKCIACGKCMEHCRFDSIVLQDGAYSVNEYFCEGCGVCRYVCPTGAVSMKPDVAGRQSLYKNGRVFSTAELKMGRGNSGKLVSAVKMALIKNAPDTELAIIDGSPGIGCPVIASVSGVDLVLVVTEPSLSGRHDLERLVNTAGTFRTKLCVCVNKADVSRENAAAIEAFCREQAIPFVGCIPYDKSASLAINQGKNLADFDCPASRALRQVYENTMKILF